jgi:hypothetical protein
MTRSAFLKNKEHLSVRLIEYYSYISIVVLSQKRNKLLLLHCATLAVIGGMNQLADSARAVKTECARSGDPRQGRQQSETFARDGGARD